MDKRKIITGLIIGIISPFLYLTVMIMSIGIANQFVANIWRSFTKDYTNFARHLRHEDKKAVINFAEKFINKELANKLKSKI